MSPLIVLEGSGTYGLKPRFQACLRPLVDALARAGVRANHVTITAAMISAAFGLWLAHFADSTRLFLWFPAVMLLRMALNAADGMLAREHYQSSALGVYLNELGDAVSDAFLYVPFAFLAGANGAWIAAVIVLSTIAEM